MRVTQIEELPKSRSRVYLEGEAAFVLYRGELNAFHIREGEEMAREDYDAVMTELLPKRAKLRAMNLLKGREYTVRQLRGKLTEGGYPERVVEEALAYVESFHYTDDLRYAMGFIMNHESDRSRRRIEQDLIGKGIDKDTLRKAWDQWEEQGGEQDEREMIRGLLEKKHFQPETAGQKERQRMYAFLVRKGFSPEEVRKVVLAGQPYL